MAVAAEIPRERVRTLLHERLENVHELLAALAREERHVGILPVPDLAEHAVVTERGGGPALRHRFQRLLDEVELGDGKAVVAVVGRVAEDGAELLAGYVEVTPGLVLAEHELEPVLLRQAVEGVAEERRGDGARGLLVGRVRTVVVVAEAEEHGLGRVALVDVPGHGHALQGVLRRGTSVVVVVVAAVHEEVAPRAVRRGLREEHVVAGIGEVRLRRDFQQMGMDVRHERERHHLVLPLPRAEPRHGLVDLRLGPRRQAARLRAKRLHHRQRRRHRPELQEFASVHFSLRYVYLANEDYGAFGATMPREADRLRIRALHVGV